MIELFRPYKIDSPKVRLGPREDGGYVTSLISLYKSHALFNYGVGHEIRYELDYYNKQQKPAYLFDHTNGRETGWDLGEGLNFFSEGLGFEENCNDFITHHERFKIPGPAFLKIDIEGGEYDYFAKTDIKKIADLTTGILIELHWISSAEYREKAIEILRKLYTYFTLTHVHGNSWGVTFDWGGYQFPDVVELTLVNNNFIDKREVDNTKYPIENLDYSNNPNKEDIDLGFLTRV